MVKSFTLNRREALLGASAALASTSIPAALWAKAPLWDGARYAFLGSRTEPKIVAIDVDMQRLETVIDLPFVPGPLAASSDHDLLFATDVAGKSVGIVDLHSHHYIGSNLLGFAPDVALISPGDGYIALGSREGKISVWEMRENREVVRISDLAPVQNLTYSRDGAALYSVDASTQTVVGLDLRSGNVVHQQKLPGNGGGATAMSRSLDGRYGYISLPNDNRLVVVDVRTLDVVHSIDLAPQPGRPYASGDGRFVLIPHLSGAAITVLSADSFDVITVIKTARAMSEVVTGWLDSTAFALSPEHSGITVLDLVDMKLGKPIDTPTPARHALVNSDSRILLTPLSQNGAVGLIDTGARQLSQIIETSVPDLTPPVMAVSGNICH